LLKGVPVTSLAVLRSSPNRICASTGQGENDMAMENAKLQGSTTGSSVKSGYSGPKGVSEPLAPGTKAPDFSLHVTPDQTLSLRELRGKPVILAFYPADWSPVCGDQMALYNEVLPEFQKFGAELLGVSVDGVWCHRAFAEARHLRFPLLADFEPKGAVAQLYGAYRNADGFSERALFVIDKSGIIAWSYRSPIAVNPGAEGILQALEELPK
jgi:peroxiredoxin